MMDRVLHPNTKTLLDAIDRLNAEPGLYSVEPEATNHPDLIDCLFVLEQTEEGAWVFCRAGEQISKTLGRELEGHDYLDLWTGQDRKMHAAFLSSVSECLKAGTLRCRGETLTGERIDIEITVAPLIGRGQSQTNPRLLGLYQTLGGAALLRGRPVWRHRLTAIFPPDIHEVRPQLKLVANND